MSMNSNIERAVKQAVSCQFGGRDSDYHAEMRLDSDQFQCDSLDMVEIIMSIESDLDISLDESCFHESMTIEDVVSAVKRQMSTTQNTGDA